MTISTIAIVMGVCFVALLYLQVTYIDTFISMRKGQLYEGAQRSLNEVAHRLEMDEMREYLAQDSRNYMKKGSLVSGNSMVVSSYTTSTSNGGVVSTITVNTAVPAGHQMDDLSDIIR